MAPVIAKVPGRLLKLGAEVFVQFQKKEMIGDKLPKRIVLFVTKKCNLKCRHCFYIPNVSSGREMSLGQIQKIADSAKNNLSQVIFTGGEPFMRKDFFEIVMSFVKNGCKTVNVITNGTMPEKVRLFLDKMLKETQTQLIFMVSVDGPQEIHDKIRAVPGSFRKTMETLSVLSDYYQKYPKRFGNVFASTTVNKLNFAHLPQTIAQIKTFKNINHSFSFARSANLHTIGVKEEYLSGFNVGSGIILNTDEMKEVLEYLNKEFWNRKSPLFSLINRQIMAETVKILSPYERCPEGTEKKTANFTCMAGQSEIIIYPEGDVGICEMLKPVGNLNEADYDLVKFYQNHRNRFQAKKSCHCTHDCALLSSIRFSPESLVEIIKHAQ